MDIMHSLQQSIGTCIGDGTGIGTSDGASTGIGAGAEDMDYCLTEDGLVRLRDGIYVRGSIELKKVILSEFHVKPYLDHPSY